VIGGKSMSSRVASMIAYKMFGAGRIAGLHLESHAIHIIQLLCGPTLGFGIRQQDGSLCKI
jgi:hypothetical protein